MDDDNNVFDVKAGKITITPEMIEAGVERLLMHNINFDDPSGVVRSVLVACLLVVADYADQSKNEVDCLER